MKISKSRHLKVLDILFKGDVVNSTFLAESCSASVRTIKNDLRELDCGLRDAGIAKIVGIQSKGYQLIILNSLVFAEFKDATEKEYHFYRRTDIEKITRRLYIAQKLLSTDWIRIEDLVDGLFISISIIKTDLIWVKDLFASYDITLVKDSKFGLTISGDEVNLREVMVEVFCNQYHDYSPRLEVVEFQGMFYLDNAYYQDLRHTFLAYLRSTVVVLSDIATKKLSTYLCLLNQRIKDNKRVTITQEVRNRIMHTLDYQLAFKLFELLQFDLTNNDEVIQFAILMLCNRDLDLKNDVSLKSIDSEDVIITYSIFETLIISLKNEIGGQLYDNEVFKKYESDFVSLLIPIYFNLQFSCNKKIRLTTYNELEQHYSTPLALEISRKLLLHLQKIIRQPIVSTAIFSFAELFDYIFKELEYEYRKLNILVVTAQGVVVTKAFSNNIYSRFNQYIATMEIYNQYEMRKLDFANYDVVITSTPNPYNFYPITFIEYPALSVEVPTTKLFYDLFIHSYKDDVLKELFNRTLIFRNFICEDYASFITLISHRHAMNETTEQLRQSLILKDEVISYHRSNSDVSLIICDFPYVMREFIEVYHLKNKILIESKREIKYVVIVAIDNQRPIAQIKLITKILQSMQYKTKYIEDLLENIEDSYKQIFSEIIANNFFRR